MRKTACAGLSALGLAPAWAAAGRQFAGPRSGRWLSFGLRITPERMF